MHLSLKWGVFILEINVSERNSPVYPPIAGGYYWKLLDFIG
ncbi:hypothetical protein PSMA106859_20380 [Pseudoalteromonas maricaloris]